jgi:hypothetical protein
VQHIAKEIFRSDDLAITAVGHLESLDLNHEQIAF